MFRMSSSSVNIMTTLYLKLPQNSRASLASVIDKFDEYMLTCQRMADKNLAPSVQLSHRDNLHRINFASDN